MRVNLENVRVNDLNNVCAMLISKFARILRESDGEVLSLRDKHVVREVARHAARTENPELKVLFSKLKMEIHRHLGQTNQRGVGLSGFFDMFKPNAKIPDEKAQDAKAHAAKAREQRLNK